SREGDPYGGDLLLRIKQTPTRSRDAMLKRLNDGLKLAVPQFDGLTYSDDAEGRPHLFAKYHHWRPHPAGQSEAHFSDG
ncbi:AAA family ATPase, partial [Acinetobacter baumannii]